MTTKSNEQRFIRVNVPDDMGRFLEVGADSLRIPLEETILHLLPALVRGVEILGHSTFRVTRDADLSLPAEADDLIEAIETQSPSGRFGDVVRVELAAQALQELVETLVEAAQDRRRSASTSAKHRSVSARLMEFTAIDRPDLKNKPWRAGDQTTFRQPEARQNCLRASAAATSSFIIRMTPSTRASRLSSAAARDSKVAALKSTVYRNRQPFGHALPRSSRPPKMASRPSASSSSKLASTSGATSSGRRALERAGVDVVYGVPDLKVHAKLTLLVRRERNGVRRYVHIGTGNYHASHATSYEDLGLFTADEDIAADVAEVFNAVTGQHAARRSSASCSSVPGFSATGS